MAWQCAYAGAMQLAIAYSSDILHIFFARDLQSGAAQLDSDEFLEVRTERIAELIQACRDGRVTDAKTLTCMLWLQNVLSGAWELDWQGTGKADALSGVQP